METPKDNQAAVDNSNSSTQENQEALFSAESGARSQEGEPKQLDLMSVFGDVPLSEAAQKKLEVKEAAKKAAEEKQKKADEKKQKEESRKEAARKAQEEAAKKEKPPEDMDLFYSDGKERRFFPAGTTLEDMRKELEEEFWNLKGEDVEPVWEVVETPEGKKVKVQFFSKHKKKGLA